MDRTFFGITLFTAALLAAGPLHAQGDSSVNTGPVLSSAAVAHDSLTSAKARDTAAPAAAHDSAASARSAVPDTAKPDTVAHESLTTAVSRDTAMPAAMHDSAASTRSAVSDTAKPDTVAAPAPAKSAAPPSPAKISGPAAPARPVFADTLGGNLPRVIAATRLPHLVVSDVYVPSGKTVKIEAGAVLLFRNFTGVQVEGRLLAEGTAAKQVVFSSELDQDYRPAAAMHANAYDWNGIYIHESGLGSSLLYCTVKYSVYGINSLTRYIRIDNVSFSDNGRSDLVVEGKPHAADGKPYSYALTIDDAKRDGVPVKILMDPNAKKRSVLRYGGLSLSVGGAVMGIWSAVELNKNQIRLTELSDSAVVNDKSVLVQYHPPDWQKAKSDRDLSRWLTAAGFLLALTGSVGLGFSFTF